MPRITLIHATPLAVQPVNMAFAADWPEASVFNLLEDSLAPDLAADGQLTETMFNRFENLASYAKDTGADGILFTCSAFGPAIEQAAQKVAPIPVLKPNEAMFREAVQSYRKLGMIATFGPSLPPMENEFQAMARALGSEATLETVLTEEAMRHLADGHDGAHNKLVAEAAKRLDHCDAIMLAQFSMAQAKPEIEAFYEKPVLTSPASAIASLKASLT